MRPWSQCRLWSNLFCLQCMTAIKGRSLLKNKYAFYLCPGIYLQACENDTKMLSYTIRVQYSSTEKTKHQKEPLLTNMLFIYVQAFISRHVKMIQKTLYYTIRLSVTIQQYKKKTKHQKKKLSYTIRLSVTIQQYKED